MAEERRICKQAKPFTRFKFLPIPQEELSQEFDIYTEPNSNGEDTDMVIELTKNNSIKGDIKMKAVIYGDDKEGEKTFGRTVKSVNEFYLFTSNNQGKASCVKEFGFNNKDLPILDKLLSG